MGPSTPGAHQGDALMTLAISSQQRKSFEPFAQFCKALFMNFWLTSRAKLAKCLRVFMLSLQISFRFLIELITGAAVLLMAKNFKEASLLAGTFLLGLSAVEAMLYFMGG